MHPAVKNAGEWFFRSADAGEGCVQAHVRFQEKHAAHVVLSGFHRRRQGQQILRGGEQEGIFLRSRAGEGRHIRQD